MTSHLRTIKATIMGLEEHLAQWKDSTADDAQTMRFRLKMQINLLQERALVILKMQEEVIYERHL